MYDLLGKLMMFIFGVFVLFIGTITQFSLRNDTTVQNFVSTETRNFVNTSRQTGTITLAQYEEFINELDSTKMLYDIEMKHYKEKSIPSTDARGYESYYEIEDGKDIIDTIKDKAKSGGVYNMNVGDFITVTVKNHEPTTGRKLLGFLVMSPASQGGQIYAYNGGYIGNER